MRAAQDADRVFSGLQFLSNWCQDLEIELYDAGHGDPSFFENSIHYCREFCDLFSDTEELLIHSMKRGQAKSHFALGREEEGERLFQALIERFPDNAWSYIGWGDMYV
jgi:hypothetical protein